VNVIAPTDIHSVPPAPRLVGINADAGRSAEAAYLAVADAVQNMADQDRWGDEAGSQGVGRDARDVEASPARASDLACRPRPVRVGDTRARNP
jgi:hypothetical protein